MIMQFGTLLASVFGGAPGASLTTALTGAIGRGVSALAPLALGVGNQFVTGLINRELSREGRNAAEDSVKARLRAAANAVSPLVAAGQTAVFSGGPPTGSAFRPPTLIPPSIQPANRVLQIDPGLVNPFVSNSFVQSRRPAPLFQEAGFGGPLLSGAARLLRRFGRSARQFDPRTPIGRRMAAVGAVGLAGETAVQFGLGAVFDPSTAEAPTFTPFPTTGDPLRISGGAVPVAPMPTGLPGIGRFQKDATGFRVQWYFWDGTGDPQPIDRSQAECLKRDCIFRLDVFRGKFVKLKSRRINPMNVRAFFRAGRRVDAGERVCRKMFTEKRKQKTGTIRRKSSHRKK